MSAQPAGIMPREVTSIVSMTSKTTKGRRLQTRSIERRTKILKAARELITSDSISELSLYEVARKAEIPPSSLYHFFPKIEHLLSALANEVFEAFEQCLHQPLSEESIRHWSNIGYILEQRMVSYYQGCTMARTLLLGQHIHSEIMNADHQHDDQMGRDIEAIYRSHFELPTLPQEYNIFAIALQLADKVYAISHQEHGNITPIMAQEGWRAARAYLSLYLPEYLPCKR